MDMVCLEMEDTIEDWEKIIFENRHSFYPVCEETKDEIIGILDVKDFFRSKDRDKYQILEYDVDAPYFVPETMRADVLLRAEAPAAQRRDDQLAGGVHDAARQEMAAHGGEILL